MKITRHRQRMIVGGGNQPLGMVPLGVGTKERINFDVEWPPSPFERVWLERDLGNAIAVLEKLSERAARVVRLRVFEGLTHEKIAVALGVTTRTVERDWVLARAILLQEFRKARE